MKLFIKLQYIIISPSRGIFVFSLLRQIEENSIARVDNFHENSILQYGNVKLMEGKCFFNRL